MIREGSNSIKKFFSLPDKVIEAPLDRNIFNRDSNITIKIKNNNTGTYVGSKSIPISDVFDTKNYLSIESDHEDNLYTILFKRNQNDNISPSSVTYNIYENLENPNGTFDKNSVAQFTIHSQFQNDKFSYYITLDKNNTNRISLDFGSLDINTSYDSNTNVTFNVSSNNYPSSISRVNPSSISRVIGIGFKEFDNSTDKSKFDLNAIKNAIENSIDDNLNISSSSVSGSVSIVNKDITESERFLKYGVITKQGDNLLVTNWVNGGVLNQVNTEIEPLGSIVLKMYNNASPLNLKDEVIFTKLYSNDIELDVDFSIGEIGNQKTQLTPNFKKEVEKNVISAFNEYQSFDELTLSGSSVQDRIIDYFLQNKKNKVGLNTDFTNFNNFVKFSSAEERLVNFHYKIEQIETYTSQSASLSESSASTSFIKNKSTDVDEKIRNIKNGFDEYELFLYNNSGSIYENKPYVSSSDNIFASWPKKTSIELISDGSFVTASLWNSNGVNDTDITQSLARLYKNGEISQSLSLSSNEIYVLEFDVVNNGLPVSFDYNGKTIVTEKVFSSGSNKFEFTTSGSSNSNNVISIKGANYGDVNKFTDIDNISIKRKPELYETTSSQVLNWYDNLREVAKDYDARNKDSLKNNTPEYIRDDEENSDYILFLNMIGHMFDGIWLYANELNNIYNWDNDITNGLSEDLSIVLLEAYGNNLNIGFSEKDAWEYILGVNDGGDSISQDIGFSFEKRQKETIRRLLVNLPYFLKNKGTSNSIKGLVLSYGIPLSTMFIREYGTFQGVNGLETIFTKEKETKKLYLSGSNKSISVDDDYLTSGSNAIEFNLQISDYSNSDINLVSGSDNVNGGGFEIFVKSDSNNTGSVHLLISTGSNSYELSSSVGPLYNGKFWNIVAQQTDSGSYEIKAYQFNRDDGTYDYQLSGSSFISSSISSSIDDAYNSINNIQFNNFNGYLDEFRIWNTSFSDEVFQEHVKFPTSVKLNDPLKIPNALLARVDVDSYDSKYIAEGENKLPNLVFNPLYPTKVTASGFTVDDFKTYTRTDFIRSTNIGNEKLGNNKVRYQLTQSLNGGVLTPNFNESSDNNENVSSVSDSYKLTIGFSPTDIINEIILQHFGGNNLLDEFGDPTDKYNETYSELQNTVESFFNNISENKKTKFFINYIRNFDKTLFDNIHEFVPERSDLSTSIFIEPHYLDRSKAKRLGQSQTEDLAQPEGVESNTNNASSTENTNTNDGNPLVTTTEETLVSDVLSEANVNQALTVISENEILDYLNQSTDVVILQDGFESQVLRNNVWESDSSITITNKYGERFKFKVYKFDYTIELQNLENQIGAYLSNNDLGHIDPQTGKLVYGTDKTYSDLSRLWKKYFKLNDTLFLLNYDVNPIDNAVLVTYEDLPTWLQEDLILSGGTTSQNKIVTKNGITYEISDDTVDGGSVVVTTTTQDSRTIVTDPNGDVKLTVE